MCMRSGRKQRRRRKNLEGMWSHDASIGSTSESGQRDSTGNDEDDIELGIGLYPLFGSRSEETLHDENEARFDIAVAKERSAGSPSASFAFKRTSRCKIWVGSSGKRVPAVNTEKAM